MGETTTDKPLLLDRKACGTPTYTPLEWGLVSMGCAVWSWWNANLLCANIPVTNTYILATIDPCKPYRPNDYLH